MTTRTALAALLLALVAPLTGGCGVVNVFHQAPPTRWPLAVQAAPAATAARPSLLVRRSVVDAAGNDRHGKLLAQAVGSAPQESGLFARVVDQAGFDGFSAATDYTLDLTLSDQVVGSWYTALGLVPGVPLVGHNEWILSCRVVDGERLPVAVFAVKATQTIAAWLPILPFNLIFSLLPGDFGMDAGVWGQEQADLLRDLVRRALAEAHRRVGFAAPPPADAPGGAPPQRR